MSDDIPEADRAGEAPHPRHTRRLFGQGAAEAEIARAIASGRLHHAWLLTGPRGVGKATLAWRMARRLLTGIEEPSGRREGLPSETLETDPDHPVARRVAALSEPGLLLIRRGWDEKAKRLKTRITVDEARKLGPFFGLSSAGGGRRVVIVDAADEMNESTANALLKVLEEPPSGAALILVCHRPARLLPTIRSRCREVRLAPLDAAAMGAALEQAGAEPADAGRLAELSAGSVGEALRLLSEDGPEIYDEIASLLAAAPGLDRQAARALSDRTAGRGAEERRDVVFRLFDLALARLARHGAGAEVSPVTDAEAQMLDRLSPDLTRARVWAELRQELSARAAHGLAVNLDPASLFLDLLLKADAAASVPARAP